MTDILLIESDRGIVRLTLNRPEKRNALSTELLKRLEQAIETIAADTSSRVVVLGSRAGLLLGSRPEGDGRSDRGRLPRALCALLAGDAGIAAVAAAGDCRVQGVATAAGCQLVAACDLAVAGDEATFATPGVKIGLFCTTPMVPLVRAIPAKPAMEMLLTGEPITARRALELGLVNRVVPNVDLDLEDQVLDRHDPRHESAGHPDREAGIL